MQNRHLRKLENPCLIEGRGAAALANGVFVDISETAPSQTTDSFDFFGIKNRTTLWRKKNGGTDELREWRGRAQRGEACRQVHPEQGPDGRFLAKKSKKRAPPSGSKKQEPHG